MSIFQRTNPNSQRPAAPRRTDTNRPPARSRLHPLLVGVVAEALHSIFVENRYADKVIEQLLRSNPKAGSKDRAFIAENTYDVVRNFRMYSEILGRKPESHSDFWQILAIHFVVNDPSPSPTLPDIREFNDLNIKKVREKFEALQGTRAIRESIPDWMDTMCFEELGDRWEPTLQWLNKPAQVVLRINRLKCDRTQLIDALKEDSIDARPVGKGQTDALYLPIRRNVFQSQAFRKGWFEVQDFSSQQVAPLLAPQPGMRVVDACAGGGGKSLHLAALMQNKGSLIALDTLEWKLNELKLRARRAGATNIETRAIDNKKVVKRLYGSADRLLLDVPCSGLGVLRRNPDSKWKITPEFIDNLRAVQQDILQSYSPILKPGGRMVYATCSILPSENNLQVAQFLASEAGKGFKLITDKSILPQDEGFDGFYMALLEKEA